MADLKIQSLHKSYGLVKVLEGLDLDIPSGEFLVLLGPSGCGKSTLLRIIAGLEDETAGDILLDGKSITLLPPAKRGIAMVFQTYALYPHLTVRGNMALVLKQARYSKQEIAARVAESARALELEPLLDRKPAELSGGQRQRVAIGRAIVRDPKVFLFDEPLSNLDAALRSQVRLEIARLHQRLSATMVYVTHDQVEAMTLADRIVVMHSGIIQQIGTPRELYEKPANLFVASFIGSPAMNFLAAEKISDGQALMAGGKRLKLAKSAPESHGPIIIGVRPGGCSLSKETDPESTIAGEVLLDEYLGDASYVHVALDNGADLVVREDPLEIHKPQERVGVKFDMKTLHLFDAKTKIALGR
ncbi:Various polyols ABC transporter, ATP-binding component [hydrothermal vent metagenome]|uniref:Various polyols ABC transporter, ATP-binding component n=1 Tax=hydrothermal vent metagenome TaxID=652676 RepID=A0A3B0U6Z3_9ZZZZ